MVNSVGCYGAQRSKLRKVERPFWKRHYHPRFSDPVAHAPHIHDVLAVVGDECTRQLATRSERLHQDEALRNHNGTWPLSSRASTIDSAAIFSALPPASDVSCSRDGEVQFTNDNRLSRRAADHNARHRGIMWKSKQQALVAAAG